MMKNGRKCIKYLLISRWIKIFNDKLLIYLKKNAEKANLIYDLRECEIRGNYIEESKFDKRNTIMKHNSNSFVNILKKSSVNLQDIYQRKRSSSNYQRQEPEKMSQLNYLIEIDHPYLQKCVLKNDYIFEALDFYKQLKQIIN